MVVLPLTPLARVVDVTAPASSDKSFTHRAIMLAAMAEGSSEIFDPLEGEDCLATLDVFWNMGVQRERSVESKGVCWRLSSPGMDHWQAPLKPQDLGNSGTSARLLLGLLAGGKNLRVTLTGDASLRKRPMGRVVEPLRNMGADITGATNGNTLELTITSQQLTSRTHYLDAPSAQVKSALILAGLSADGETIIDLPQGGRDHTENMLEALGAPIQIRNYLGRERIFVTGPWRPRPFKCEVPSDPSSVAFFAGMAALHPGLRVKAHKVLRNKTRTGFFKCLEAMGVDVTWSDIVSRPEHLGEEVGTVSFLATGRPRAATVAASEAAMMLDEIPMLGAVCAMASGRSRIEGLGELRVKESDRQTRIIELLTKAGVEARIDGDAIEIEGQAEINAFSFGSDDHRMVMTAMILATKGKAPSEITGISWINTSFPLFLRAFQNINLGIQ